MDINTKSIEEIKNLLTYGGRKWEIILPYYGIKKYIRPEERDELDPVYKLIKDGILIVKSRTTILKGIVRVVELLEMDIQINKKPFFKEYDIIITAIVDVEEY